MRWHAVKINQSTITNQRITSLYRKYQLTIMWWLNLNQRWLINFARFHFHFFFQPHPTSPRKSSLDLTLTCPLICLSIKSKYVVCDVPVFFLLFFLGVGVESLALYRWLHLWSDTKNVMIGKEYSTDHFSLNDLSIFFAQPSPASSSRFVIETGSDGLRPFSTDDWNDGISRSTPDMQICEACLVPG